MTKKSKTLKEGEIRELYRQTLKNDKLSDQKVDEIRGNMRVLAELICEHVWQKKVH